MKFKLTKDAGLNEDILNEEQYFKVYYRNKTDDKSDTGYVYAVASNKDQAEKNVRTRDPKENYEDSVILPKDPDIYKIEEVPYNQVQKEAHRYYLTSHRTLRDRAHKKLNNTIKNKKPRKSKHSDKEDVTVDYSNIFDDLNIDNNIDSSLIELFVHHRDGIESNNDEDNLCGIPYTKGDKKSLSKAHTLHQLFHFWKIDPVKGSPIKCKIVVWDYSQKRYVLKDLIIDIH